MHIAHTKCPLKRRVTCENILGCDDTMTRQHNDVRQSSIFSLFFARSLRCTASPTRPRDCNNNCRFFATVTPTALLLLLFLYTEPLSPIKKSSSAAVTEATGARAYTLSFHIWYYFRGMAFLTRTLIEKNKCSFTIELLLHRFNGTSL